MRSFSIASIDGPVAIRIASRAPDAGRSPQPGERTVLPNGTQRLPDDSDAGQPAISVSFGGFPARARESFV